MSEKSKALRKNEFSGSDILVCFGEFLLIIVLLYTLDVMILRNGSFDFIWAVSSAAIITFLTKAVSVLNHYGRLN